MPAVRRAAALVGGLSLLTGGLAAVTTPAQADVSATIASFPYTQDWSDGSLITVNDNWSGVAGVQGYLGTDLVTAAGADPRDVTADGSGVTDVIANGAPSSTSGGVLEAAAEETIALQGSGSADVPHVVFHLDLSDQTGATFSFDARDIDGSADNATQQVAVQYRVGASGAYTNLPDGYVADATDQGSATKVTPVSVTLPDDAAGAADVFVRVLTADAPGSDEWVGIDNIVVETGPSEPSALAATDPADVTATEGVPISPITLRATGGTSPYSWTVTGLPEGLSETSDGVIEGTPTDAGVFTVTATATDSASPTPASDSVDFTITVESVQARSIAEIQGTGAASPFAGETVTTRGVVTAAYPTGGFFGFVIQTEGTGGATDASPGASDALWVYQASGAVAAEIGQHVELTGEVAERFGRTELTYTPAGGAPTVLGEPFVEPTPLTTTFWPTEAEREAHESELLDLSDQAFTVTNNYSTNQFGEIGLATGGRPLITPTEVANPDLEPAGYEAVVADNLARGLILDDGSSWNYLSNETAQDTPLPWLDEQTTASVGASAALTGPVVLDYGFSKWRLQPTQQVTGTQPELVTFGDARSENAAPQDVGGDLKLATFNVLNYFNTTGTDFVTSGAGTCSYYRDRDGDEVTNNQCNPNGPRGAAEDEDLERQQAKIVAAINALDASVVSLEEIENSAAFGEDRDDALSALTEALNQAAGADRWAFVPSPPADELPASEDVIRTAFIYDPSAVELVGGSVIYDGPAFSNARQPLAQAFTAAGSDTPESAFALIVNHFKSKGSACSGEPEGPQGNCNESRIAQARALAGFADDFAVDRGLEQIFLAGDFNSYTEEDPMLALEDEGFTQLASDTADEWSYSFDGMSGSLDHVLANDAALANVTGVDIWEINATEALAYEYSRHNYNVTDFYAADVFRASDHNPEIVGIDVPAPRERVDMDVTLSPRKVHVRKSRPRLVVEVEDGNHPRRQTVSGVVRVSFEDEVRTERLRRGEARFRLGTFDTPGRVTVTVEYLGSRTHAPMTETFRFRVRPAKR